MNQHSRIIEFTRRQVRERESLFNPETAQWPEDQVIGPSTNWGWIFEILLWFGLAAALGCFMIVSWLGWLLIGF